MLSANIFNLKTRIIFTLANPLCHDKRILILYQFCNINLTIKKNLKNNNLLQLLKKKRTQTKYTNVATLLEFRCVLMGPTHFQHLLTNAPPKDLPKGLSKYLPHSKVIDFSDKFFSFKSTREGTYSLRL